MPPWLISQWCSIRYKYIGHLNSYHKVLYEKTGDTKEDV